MKQPFFSSVGSSKSFLLVIGLSLALFTSHVRSSQVVAIGYNYDPLTQPALTNAVAVGVRTFSLVALRADGTVAEWRNGASDPAVSNIVSFTSGWSHGFGFQADGTLIGWGNDFGGGISEKPTDLTNAVALGIGSFATLAVLEDGTVTGWGYDSEHILNVPAGLSNVVALSVGAFGDNVLALRADGTVSEWGYDYTILQPYTNTHPEFSNIVALAAANSYRSAVLHFDGHVTAWPNNPPDDVPPSNLTNIIAIAGGGSHLLALHDNGTVTAWGCNCGGATTIPPNLTNVTAIAAGGGDGIDFSIFLIGHSNPPPVLSLSRSNQTVSLTLAGQAFRRYVIEQSGDLNSPQGWSFKQNLTLPSTAQTTLDLPSNGEACFYRARLMP